MMDSRNVFALLLVFLSGFSVCLAEDVTVTVNGVTAIASTEDNFICVTIDWWPPTKCNYNMCPWGMSSILNLDLENPILAKAIKAFNPLRIRLGGSLQDQVVYNVNGKVKHCHNFRNISDGLFGFSRGCLPMDRWDALNKLFSSSGAVLTFGLNALIGRKQISGDLWGGAWKTKNARQFMEYTVSKGYKVDSWELGNELSGSGVAARVEANQYGEDVIALKALVNKLYQNSSIQPRVLAPGGFFDQKWFTELLQTSGTNVLDVMTHHIYNLGAGVDPNLVSKILDPFYLSQMAQTFKDLKQTIQSFGPWSSAWVGESGGAYNSGGEMVSNTFVYSFWYLDQLGMSSVFGTKVYCRQAFIGGNYCLLNTTTMVPNPDYYSALLWHRLMGSKVLSTVLQSSPYLRTYAHCSKKKPGITLLLINLSNSTSFNITVIDDTNIYSEDDVKSTTQREEYHLTPKDGNIRSQTMLLNGSPLELTDAGDIPPLNPVLIDNSPPINISPLSIKFVTLRDFQASACA